MNATSCHHVPRESLTLRFPVEKSLHCPKFGFRRKYLVCIHNRAPIDGNRVAVAARQRFRWSSWYSSRYRVAIVSSEYR